MMGRIDPGDLMSASGWHAPIDSYCERVSAAFWAEPMNAVTNAAFLVAAALALVLWRRAGGRDLAALWLIAVVATVGVGSFLFHTVATRWALLADVLPIAVFIYSYFFLSMRRYLHLGILASMAVTVLFAAFNLSFDRIWFGVLPGVTLNGSVGYLPAAMAMVAVGAVCLHSGTREAGRALFVAAGVFTLSLLFRSVDEVACGVVPAGTHFLWHGLNAVVLFVLMKAAIAHRSHTGVTLARD